jgi:hypothetical protein
MKVILKTIIVSALAFAFASCAQTEARTPLRASPAGTRFDESGRVTLHRGQPCSPQVMFNFQPRNGSSPVGLAARLQDSKLLTEAVRRKRLVHVSGVWRHGRDKACGFVEVTRAVQE